MPHKRTPNPKNVQVSEWLTFDKSFLGDDKKTYWICKCVCGQTVAKRANLIIRGDVKSCGCKKPRKDKAYNWKGCGGYHGSQFSMVKQHARLRNIHFDITIELAWSLFVQQEGKCALTGLPIVLRPQSEMKKGNKKTASLDRINSEKGYIPGNVWWVHKDVNRMKSFFPLEYFDELCRLVVERKPLREVPSQALPEPSPCTEAAPNPGLDSVLSQNE